MILLEEDGTLKPRPLKPRPFFTNREKGSKMAPILKNVETPYIKKIKTDHPNAKRCKIPKHTLEPGDGSAEILSGEHGVEQRAHTVAGVDGAGFGDRGGPLLERIPLLRGGTGTTKGKSGGDKWHTEKKVRVEDARVVL